MSISQFCPRTIEGLWYISGPMTWIPQMNIPAFDAAAADLREQFKGAVFISPAELDSPEVREAAMASLDGAPGSMPDGSTYGDFLARDAKMLGDGHPEHGTFDGMIALPGWEASTGARLESFILRAIKDKPIVRYPDFSVVTWDELVQAWQQNRHVGAWASPSLAIS